MKNKRTHIKFNYITSCLLLTCSCAGYSANAQEVEEEQVIELITVSGAPILRDRTTAIAPELEYGVEFFQRFEPTSVGDMLKRTPGVAFSSDVGEYDAPQLRGLGEGYTQVLINGRKIPGAGSDRAVFVDRIPAELVKSIKIIRSPSADQNSSGVGGTIDIILKDGATFQGGSARLGAMQFDGEKYRSNTALAYGGDTNDMSWTVSANFQERYVPKDKIERVFDPEDNSLKSEEFEEDVRDSDDISLNSTLAFDLDDFSVLELAASYISTSREENQVETVYEIEDGERILDGLAQDDVDIKEDSYFLSAVYLRDLDDGGEWETYVTYSAIDSTEDALIFEKGDFEDAWEFDALEEIDAEDSELLLGTKVTSEIDEDFTLKYGVELASKEREESITETALESDTGAVDEVDLFQSYDATENRVDAYIASELSFGDDVVLEVGARVEHTELEIDGLEMSSSNNSTEFNPSAHLSWRLSSTATFRASVAKTVRRPNFAQLSPNIELDEPEDGDAKQGNPFLQNETSYGLDIGTEFSLESGGIFGVNAFYRDVSDVIEESGVGIAPGGGLLFSYNNAGDGKVWGIEFDLNKRLTDDTAFFANVSLLDSEITDQFTGRERRFRDQADYVYNLGVTHNIPSWGASMGFSYQKQGDSESVDIDRDATLAYDGNLEIFIEKRFGDDYVLRLTGTNLLDAGKFERFLNYDGDTGDEIITNHINGDVDEIETEVETAGRVITLTFRANF